MFNVDDIHVLYIGREGVSQEAYNAFLDDFEKKDAVGGLRQLFQKHQALIAKPLSNAVYADPNPQKSGWFSKSTEPFDPKARNVLLHQQLFPNDVCCGVRARRTASNQPIELWLNKGPEILVATKNYDGWMMIYRHDDSGKIKCAYDDAGVGINYFAHPTLAHILSATDAETFFARQRDAAGVATIVKPAQKRFAKFDKFKLG